MAVAIIMCIILRFLENHISAFSITSKADRAALISRFSPKDREKHRQRYTSYHDFVQEKFLLFQFQCNQKEPRDVGARGARGAGQGRGAARGAPGDPGAGSHGRFPVLVPGAGSHAVLVPAAPPSEKRWPAAGNHGKVQIYSSSQEGQRVPAFPMQGSTGWLDLLSRGVRELLRKQENRWPGFSIFL